MLFEKIRRTQKPVFIFLALIFGFGFVLLGVGSGTGGVNPLDIFGNNSGSSSSIDDLNQQVKDHPNDSAAWLSLARAYAADQQYDPALGAYQTYLSLKPNDVRATASAATLYETRARQTSAAAAVSSFRHTGTADSAAPIGKRLRCCDSQRTRTSTETSSEGFFAETRSSTSSAFKTWASRVRMTSRFCNGPPTRGASSSRTISRRWRNMHSIGLQQVSRCQGSSR